MGTLIGHVVPGAGIALVGIWHLFNLLRSYARNPAKFHTRPWYQAQLPGEWKYVELYAIIFGSALHMAAELVIFPKRHHPFDSDGSIPSEHLNNFEHASMSLFFLIYGMMALYGNAKGKMFVPQGLLNLFGAAALSQELLLFHFHSADHMGLEGHYHWLLQLPIIVGIGAVLLEIKYPRSIVLSTIRAMSFIDQGLWLHHMGLALWIPIFIPKGCLMNPALSRDGHNLQGSQHGNITEGGMHVVEPGVICLEPGSDMRAKALANLSFNWYFAALLVATVFLFTYIHKREAKADGESLPLYERSRQPVYEVLSESDLAEAEVNASKDTNTDIPSAGRAGQDVESGQHLWSKDGGTPLVELTADPLELELSAVSLIHRQPSSDSQEFDGHSPTGSSSPFDGRCWTHEDGEMVIKGFNKIKLDR